MLKTVKSRRFEVFDVTNELGALSYGYKSNINLNSEYYENFKSNDGGPGAAGGMRRCQCN